METTKLTHDGLYRLFKRAQEQLKEGHPLREHIRDRLTEVDELVANVITARKAQFPEGFEKTLGAEDKRIYQAFKFNQGDLMVTPSEKEALLLQEFDYGLPAARKRYNELEAMRKPLTDYFYRDEMRAVVKSIMEAKKEIFETPGGRDIILKVMDEQLADHNDKCETWFSGALKGADTRAKIFINHASPNSFVSALEGSGDNHIMNTIVDQARELAYLEGKPLTETMAGRLKAVGLTDFQTQFFTAITKAHENGVADKLIKGLYRKHKPEIKRLEAEHRAYIQKILKLANKARTEAEVAQAKLDAKAAEFEAAADAARMERKSKEIAQESKGLLKLLARNKTPVAVGATAAAAIGGWALYESQKRKQSEPAQSKT